jgi:hypothetical protein
MELILEIIREHIEKHIPTHIKRISDGFHFNGFCLKEDGKNLLFNDKEDGKMLIPISDIDIIERPAPRIRMGDDER